MVINDMKEEECGAFLTNASLGRLGCSLDNQPYVVPIYFAYEPAYIYGLSTFGQKTEWMRANPRVCLEVDEIKDQSQWISVIANGHYEELPEPQYTAEVEHARKAIREAPPVVAKRARGASATIGRRVDHSGAPLAIASFGGILISVAGYSNSTTT